MLGILDAHELARALECEEAARGVSRDAPDLPPEAAANFQAAWERAELARSEIENDHPLLNAQALLRLNSALDAWLRIA